jgi:amino acid adenylation domain-containing protein
MQTIHGRFEKQVLKCPSQSAIRSRDADITYASLNNAANRIARAILAGCGDAGGQVALLFGLGPAAISAIIGTLKSGKVYVPMDPAWPYDWASYILDDSEATAILADHRTIGMAEELARSKCRVINIDEIGHELSDENPGSTGSPDSPAYILYTSGSTGRSKGVVHTHRNLLQQIRNYTNNVGITPEDRLLLLHSLSFGASPMNLYGSLLNGATVFPYSVKEYGVSRLADWIAAEQITVCHFGPTLFRHFAGALTGESRFPALRLINLGGETVYARDVELFKNHFERGCILVNSLACTEVGTFAQYFVDHDSEVSGERIPAGHAFGDIEISLVDDNGDEAEEGQAGEIVLRSGYLSLGYWRNPELTRKVFCVDPDRAGTRIFSTGDMGRMSPDGVLEHIGRKDFQVKIRGYRIEIAEVEAVLRGLAGIKEAVVVGVDEQLGDKRLVAYLVADEDRERQSVTVLRAQLGQRLPEYMIPAQFVFIDSLPLTQSGKMDRNSLREPKIIDRPSLREGFVGPRTEIESMLVKIWARLLNIRQVGIDDNFFELGGDSLAAIELLRLIEREYGKRFLPYELLQSPTIRQIGTLISERDTRKAASYLVMMKSGGSKPPLFLLPGVTDSVLLYRELIKYLAPDQFVYGIEGSEDVLHKPIEEVASHYVNEICRTFPSGPFLLIGYSSGGVMAFEIARQLLTAHREVALLCMLDTFFPRALHPEVPVWEKILSSHFVGNLPFWLYYSFPFWMKSSRRIITNWVQHQTNQSDLRYDIQKKVIRWLRNYSPTKYPGRIMLYQARAHGLFEVDQKKKWESVCAVLDSCIVPGDHASILRKPYAEFLAEKINAELNKVCARA